METVKVIDWHPIWDGGAPMPQVFSNGRKIYLIYSIAEWDEDSITEIKSIDNSKGNEELLALVEFNGHTFRFGIANDEVFPGLPLYKNGLNEWAHTIENSKWIDELKQIHKVHHYYSELNWTKKNHYAFLFKDEILEVIATDYQIDVYKTSYDRLGAEIINRMNL